MTNFPEGSEQPGATSAVILDVLKSDLTGRGVMDDEVRNEVLSVIAERAAAEEDGETTFKVAQLMSSSTQAVNTLIRAESFGKEGSLVAAATRAAGEPDAKEAFYSWRALSRAGVEGADQESFLAADKITFEPSRLHAFSSLAEAAVPGADEAAHEAACKAENVTAAVITLIRLAELGHPRAFITAIGRVANAQTATAVTENFDRLAAHQLAKEPALQQRLEKAATTPIIENYSPDVRVLNLLTLAKHGNLDALQLALTLAKEIEVDENSRPPKRVLGRVTTTAIGLDRIAVAEEAANAIQDPGDKSFAWEAIAKKTGEAAATEKAHTAAMQIAYPSMRASQLVDVSRLGHPTALQEAREVLESLGPEGQEIHSNIWGSIAEAYVRSGQLEKALQLVVAKEGRAQKAVRRGIAVEVCEMAARDPVHMSEVHRLYRDADFQPFIAEAAQNAAFAMQHESRGNPITFVPFLRTRYAAKQLVTAMLEADKG